VNVTAAKSIFVSLESTVKRWIGGRGGKGGAVERKLSKWEISGEKKVAKLEKVTMKG